MMTDMPVIDTATFENLRSVCDMGGEGVLGALITDFLSDSQRIIGEMNETITHEDRATFERLAHTPKGTSGMFGATRLSLRFAKLEGLAKAASLGEIGAMLAALAPELALVRAELKSRIA